MVTNTRIYADSNEYSPLIRSLTCLKASVS
jgi:hypothetical protein